MCRAGGRRCKGSHASSRATQTARKQRSRAKQALRQAKAAGDPEAIAAAQQRLDQANANVQAAKENVMHHNDNHETADHGGDVTTPKAAPAPITGELSDKPLLDNTWGHLGSNSAVHYHDDGPVGTAVKYMGQDARMDVDGEPLANVVGRIATDVVRRNTKAQQAVDDLKELRDRLPEGSRAKQCLSNAVRNMDGPDTPEPQVPDGTPEPLKDLVRKLHAVPMVRREPETELQPLLKICDRAATGDRRTLAMLDDEVQRLRNKRHESLGDSGKFEIDDAVSDTVTTLREQERQQREERAKADAGGPEVRTGKFTQTAGQVGSRNDINTDDVTFTVNRPAHDGDVTSEPPSGRTEARSQRGGPRGRSVTNIADGGSHVGVQAGVVFGEVRVNGRRVSTGTAGQQGDVTGPRVQSGQHDGDVTNIATGGSHVDMQVGVVYGNARTGRAANASQANTNAADARQQMTQKLQQLADMDRERKQRTQREAAQDRDVAPTQSAFRTSSGGVTNIVHGNVNGPQMDTINGDVHIGPNGIWVNGKRIG